MAFGCSTAQRNERLVRTKYGEMTDTTPLDHGHEKFDAVSVGVAFYHRREESLFRKIRFEKPDVLAQGRTTELNGGCFKQGEVAPIFVRQFP